MMHLSGPWLHECHVLHQYSRTLSIRRPAPILYCLAIIKRLMKNGFEEAASFRSCRRELCVQPIAQRHQLIHLRDNAALFGKWWNRDGQGDAWRNVQSPMAKCGREHP